jgi:hypothetical protein
LLLFSCPILFTTLSQVLKLLSSLAYYCSTRPGVIFIHDRPIATTVFTKSTQTRFSMISTIFLVFLIFVSPLALSAPTSIDSNTLLQNGQAAQQLNAEFLNLKVTDPCNSACIATLLLLTMRQTRVYYVAGDTACISGLMAQCSNGAWQTQKCPGGTRECFALPSVKNNGTVRTMSSFFPLLQMSTFPCPVVHRMHK